MENINVEQIGQLLLDNHNFLAKLQTKLAQPQKHLQLKAQAPLEVLIEEVRQLLQDLIHHQLQNELKQIIEDNNRILLEIKNRMSEHQKQEPIHQLCEDISFSQVHRIMDEERKKLKIPQEVNDAELERSISAFVELKVQTIEQRVLSIDKRLRGMEDKYQTNLKSIWNVLSITESAIFDHLKDSNKKCNLQKSAHDSELEAEKKSFFGSIFKIGK